MKSKAIQDLCKIKSALSHVRIKGKADFIKDINGKIEFIKRYRLEDKNINLLLKDAKNKYEKLIK